MRIKNLFIAFIAISTLGACNKVLDVKPESDLDANDRFQELEDYYLSLQGTYSLFRNTSYYGATDAAANAFVTMPDILSEDLLSSPAEDLGNEAVFHFWEYNSAETQIEDVWANAYRIISQANITMDGIDRFAEEEGGKVNRIKSQALAIRGLVHFDLLRYWANDYTNFSDPGIPYIDKFDYEVKPGRGTVGETYNKIEKDLLDAKDLMQNMDDDINPGVGSPAYIDENVINAILARMYLYKGDMDKAIQFSTLVINEFNLTDRARFNLIWQDVDVTEVVWSLVFNAGQGAPGSNVYAPDINRAQYVPNPDLVAMYSANDIRLTSYFQVRPRNNGVNRRVLIKYLAKSASLAKPDGNVNFKSFRVAEMYLIRAEAYAKATAPDEAKAMADLNKLRAARISGYTNENLVGQDLLDAIELERRKELVAEGHRFFDLKRKGINDREVERTDATLPPESPLWAWPIPQAEIDANPAIKPQNPGYGD
jgi:hypothetical protein